VAQPDYVPTTLEQQPRKGLPLPPPARAGARRPGEITVLAEHGRGQGSAGPDQGYVLTLAQRFAGHLNLAPGEHEADALAGAVAVALKRASIFGRAPVVHDLDVALRIWGFLGETDAELVAARAHLFAGAAHHYELQRAVADAVPPAVLQLPHAEVARRLPADWRSFVPF
jgi:hypothetical protein